MRTVVTHTSFADDVIRTGGPNWTLVRAATDDAWSHRHAILHTG